MRIYGTKRPYKNLVIYYFIFVFYNTNNTLPITFHTEPDIFGPPEQDAVVSLIFHLLASAFGGLSINKITANVCRYVAQTLKIAIFGSFSSKITANFITLT